MHLVTLAVLTLILIGIERIHCQNATRDPTYNPTCENGFQCVPTSQCRQKALLSIRGPILRCNSFGTFRRFICCPRTWDGPRPHRITYVSEENSEVECPDPGFVSNGYRVKNGNSSITIEKFSVNQFVGYICDNGFHLQGSRTITCLRTGMWSDEKPYCIPSLTPSPTISTAGPVSSITSAKPMDCADVLHSGQNRSGVYIIWPRNRLTDEMPLRVYCDMRTDEGGWTVIQRRGNFNKPKDYFYKDWETYKRGFGDIEEDFWLGNDYIFALTNQRLYSVRFDLKAVSEEKRYAVFFSFWIDDENNDYTLHIEDYHGDAGDSMLAHGNTKFSTKDRENDIEPNDHCAQKYKGGWWFKDCHQANLNGLYLKGPHSSFADGVNWLTFKGLHESLEETEIKIRPRSFVLPSAIP